MPEVVDQYIGAVSLLPTGNQMARGHEVAHSCDANENVLSRADANSVLDFRLYQVEFIGSKVTELTTDVIAESMYAQCDAEGNEHLLLILPIDHKKEEKAISL